MAVTNVEYSSSALRTSGARRVGVCTLSVSIRGSTRLAFCSKGIRWEANPRGDIDPGRGGLSGNSAGSSSPRESRVPKQVPWSPIISKPGRRPSSPSHHLTSFVPSQVEARPSTRPFALHLLLVLLPILGLCWLCETILLSPPPNHQHRLPVTLSDCCFALTPPSNKASGCSTPSSLFLQALS